MNITILSPSKHLLDSLNKFKLSAWRDLTIEDFTSPKVIKVFMKYARKHTAEQFEKLAGSDKNIASQFFSAALIS